MPSITLTPGSSASSIISLTFNAGASLGNIGFGTGGGGGNYDDPYSYLVLTAGGTYYWATVGGVSELVEALNVQGDPPTQAEKMDFEVWDVRGVVLPDFAQAGNNYILSDGFGGYTWCDSGGTEEGTPVDAYPVDTFSGTATREGEIYFYAGIIGGGGGS
jgi:hypothetical protein